MRQLLNGQDHTVGFNASILSIQKLENQEPPSESECGATLNLRLNQSLYILHKNRIWKKRMEFSFSFIIVSFFE